MKKLDPVIIIVDVLLLIGCGCMFLYGKMSAHSLFIVGIILIVVGVAMIGWGFEWNQDITNDKRVGTVVRDIGVMVLATGIIFVMQRAMN